LELAKAFIEKKLSVYSVRMAILNSRVEEDEATVISTYHSLDDINPLTKQPKSENIDSIYDRWNKEMGVRR